MELHDSADDGLARSLVSVAKGWDRREAEAGITDIRAKFFFGQQDLRGTHVTQLLKLVVGVETLSAFIAISDHFVGVGKKGVADFVADRKILAGLGLGAIKDDFELLAFPRKDERIVPWRQAIGRQSNAEEGGKCPWIERRSVPSKLPRLGDEGARSLPYHDDRINSPPIILNERDDGGVLPDAPSNSQVGRPLSRSCSGLSA